METMKSTVQEQFNRCARHYLENSPMADRVLLELIVRLAKARPEDHTLDVACGAGFLVNEFAPVVRTAVGVDLSPAMLAAARNAAIVLGLANTGFELADGEELPFPDESFDIVTCKLALHYFPDPGRAIGEMKRVAKSGARLVLIDRVASKDGEKQEYHNRIEKLRTPSKVKVYSPTEIQALLAAQGLPLVGIHHYEQQQDFEEWLETTGAGHDNRQHARELMLRSLEEDLAGLKVRWEGGRVMMTHSTAIFVARK
ncbi:MAG: class I SAM-dependent methyltransferase [Geobacter sp.]|nr:class I SAM-dependent methyltransferase [Geobacter sp.]